MEVQESEEEAKTLLLLQLSQPFLCTRVGHEGMFRSHKSGT